MKHIFDTQRNVKRAIYVLFILCVLSLIAELFVQGYVDHPWEALFGFYGLYGFVACVLLVLGAKEMRKILMRRDDYYDE